MGISGQSFRAETYAVLGSTREPSVLEQAALEGRGYFFTTLDSQSLGQMYAGDRSYFKAINSSLKLREFSLGRSVKLAICPSNLRLDQTNWCLQAEQFEVVDAYSKSTVEAEFDGGKAIMLPAVGYAQLDIAYSRATGGRRLFADFYARCLDMIDGEEVVSIGRSAEDRGLDVFESYYLTGNPAVWAVPVVVFTAK